MSSTSLLYQRMQNAFLAGSATDAHSAFEQWQASNCYYPQRLLIDDAHTQQKRWITIPCGRCYHCMETKVNEWVTRMYAHAEDFKYVYFITLTYRSFANVQGVNALLLRKLSSAVWTYDDANINHRLAYNPCVLVKKHYQDFFKRLRKQLPDVTLSYACCGEMGKRFGRPHFHAILFADKPITREQVVRAWSVALWRSDAGNWSYKTSQNKNGAAYYFPIGRVDYNDLVANGSFNTGQKIRVDGEYMDVTNCFAYVCKYVCKRDSYNKSRVLRAWNSMYYTSDCVELFGDEIQVKDAAEYLRSLQSYSSSQIDLILNNLPNVYEKVFPYSQPDCYAVGLPETRTVCASGCRFDVPYYPSDLHAFCSLFAPFVEFSRGTALGSLFAQTHIQEFADGVFNQPILQDKGYVLPRYFVAKAKDFVCGLREVRKTISGVSYPRGRMLERLRLFKDGDTGSVSDVYGVVNWSPAQVGRMVKQQGRALFDSWTKEHMLIHAGQVLMYKYSRSQREYVQTRTMPVSEWIRVECVKLQRDMDSYKLSISHADENYTALQRSKFYMYCLGLPYSHQRDSFVAAQDAYLHRKQKEYDVTHLSLE